VNYWERYGGDYARDTAHLNLAENGAYGLLLDVQYSTERGLPESYDALARICRASGKIEQAAVRSVADQYLPVGDDGLRWNPRAAREIAKAQRRIDASRLNGKHGGRKPGGNPMGTRQEPGGNPMGSPPATRPGEALPHAPSPTPTPQAKARAARKRAPDLPLPDGFTISERVRQWAAANGVTELGKRFEHFVGKARARGYTYADWDEAFMGAVRDDWAGLNGRKQNDKQSRREQTLHGLTGGLASRRSERVIDQHD